MKKIPLRKSTLELADCWEDLSFKQLFKTFEVVIIRLLAGELTPVQARIEMLILYTNYKPNPWIVNPETRENINFNLLKLSEQITFAFEVEETETGGTIIPNYKFKRPPIPYIKIGLKKYHGKRFLLDLTAKTDITAREFVDCFDLLRATNEVEALEDKEELINQICAILYPKCKNHTENLVSGHIEAMRKVNPVIKYIIMYWFSGIVKFYTEHPIYSILFSRPAKESEEGAHKISLGMNEVCLFLQREGYGITDTMNLNDYFDAQVKSLKDTISKAIAEGAKIEKISQETGLSFYQIEQLK
jgi:hypothetical protein